MYFCIILLRSYVISMNTYFLNRPLNGILIFLKTPFLFSFSATSLKHSSHNARRLTGRLSFKDPLICSNCGWMLAPNFVEHFWHRWRALSKTVCLILIVRCLYLLLSTLPLWFPPKKDNKHSYSVSNLILAERLIACDYIQRI